MALGAGTRDTNDPQGGTEKGLPRNKPENCASTGTCCHRLVISHFQSIKGEETGKKLFSFLDLERASILEVCGNTPAINSLSLGSPTCKGQSADDPLGTQHMLHYFLGGLPSPRPCNTEQRHIPSIG